MYANLRHTQGFVCTSNEKKKPNSPNARGFNYESSLRLRQLVASRVCCSVGVPDPDGAVTL